MELQKLFTLAQGILIGLTVPVIALSVYMFIVLKKVEMQTIQNAQAISRVVSFLEQSNIEQK